MSDAATFVGQCYEGTPLELRSYVENLDEDAITIASIDEINYLIKSYASRGNAETDTDSTAVVAETSAGAVSSLVSNTLLDWRVDGRGYNFFLKLPGSSFPTKRLWYVVEVWITPQDGSDDFPAGIWILECVPTRRD